MPADKIEASKRLVDDTYKLFEGILKSPIEQRYLFRPPFKFLVELVRQLISDTKVMRDVFNPKELHTKRIWDKQAKLDFVQRIIQFAANNKQPVVGCIPTKVVAGLEPNKTNELLQALARVARAKLAAQNQHRPSTYIKPMGSPAHSRNSLPSTIGSAKSTLSSLTTDQSQPVDSSKGSSRTLEPETVAKVLPARRPTEGTLQKMQPFTALGDPFKHLDQVRLELRALRAAMMKLSDIEDSIRDSLQVSLVAKRGAQLLSGF